METGIQTDSIFSYDGQMEFMNQMYQQMQWFNPFYLQSFQNWNQQVWRDLIKLNDVLNIWFFRLLNFLS